jgi:hypothetical protein
MRKIPASSSFNPVRQKGHRRRPSAAMIVD